MKVSIPNSEIQISETPTNQLLVRWYAGLEEGLAFVKISNQTKRNLQDVIFFATACASHIRSIHGIMFYCNNEYDVIFFPASVSKNLQSLTTDKKFIKEFVQGEKQMWFVKRMTNRKHVQYLPIENTYLILRNGFIFFQGIVFPNNIFSNQFVFTVKINFDVIGLD